MYLSLSRDSAIAQDRGINRTRDSDGNVIGRANNNPILDTWEYVVEFKDGKEAAFAANTIAQSMYAQCDPDENQSIIFDSIVDFRRSTTTLCYADQRIIKKDGWHFMRHLTADWQLCIQ